MLPMMGGLGLLACLLLTLRFAPNWIAFRSGLSEAWLTASSPSHHAAVERAILNGHSERGYYVVQQTRSLST